MLQQLKLETGGRPVTNDDFAALQNAMPMLGLPTLLTGMGPCIVSGCPLYRAGSIWNVGAGMVWDGSNLLPFPGRSNVRFPAMFVPGPVVTVDERAYQTGGTKTTITGQVMMLVDADPALADPLILYADGAITIWQRVQERTRELGTVEYITDASGYDVTGLGRDRKRGWALCNGQNGTVDLRGQFVLGWNPDRLWDAHGHSLTPNSVGDSGGVERVALELGEMPSHQHRMTPTKHDAALGNGSENGNWTRIAAGHPSSRKNSPGDPSNFTDSQGNGQAHENRPPFYSLAARQWIGL